MQGIDTLRDKSRLVFFVDVEMEEARCRALTHLFNTFGSFGISPRRNGRSPTQHFAVHTINFVEIPCIYL